MEALASRDGDPQDRAGGNGRGAAIALRISWNRLRCTITSAIMLVDQDTNIVVFGGDPFAYSADLDQVEQFLTRRSGS